MKFPHGKRTNLRKIVETEHIEEDGSAKLASRFTMEYFDQSYVLTVNEQAEELKLLTEKSGWGKNISRHEPDYEPLKQAGMIDW